MQVIFYRAEYGDWIDKLIAFWTHGAYSHCEILFNDGYMWSASQRENRVRIKPHFKGDQWEYVYVDVSAIREVEIYNFLVDQLGKKYDWLGVFGFVLPFRHSRSKWFCSELCAAAFGFENSHKISPNKLYEILKCKITEKDS